ncbi:helicase-related protein [Nonomuraea sp. NPDC005983]|uniref:helicase-related protein n=1 Tax=Nonomuraea sp. NPDC005983 TaxID=3155595 RepID=UPI0033AA8DB9
MAELFEPGQRVRLPHGPSGWLTVDFARPDGAGGWVLYVAPEDGDTFSKVTLTADEAELVEILKPDGGGSSAGGLAGMWTLWMAAATTDTTVSPPSATPLRPYIHQHNAVYGAMLPQPRLRFLLADEPGTGKTVMAGLYLREMRRLGLVRRALIVAPAGLVTKWQADFERFFGGGLRRITAATVREGALELEHNLWVTSLELAAVNSAVQEAVHPERTGWDLVVFDEAHRLTPTARSFHRVGRLLGRATPRVLLMTATPHRGSEWLFRHLLHLVDPEIYPDPGDDSRQPLTPLRPGSIHFLRRMKESLVDYDGITPLFKKRRATNLRVPLSPDELDIYNHALSLVDEFFPSQARSLARMVYGKRAASSLFALARTLERRLAGMGNRSPVEAAAEADPESEDQAVRDEAKVVHADSRSPRAEKAAVRPLLGRILKLLATPGYTPSKWSTLVERCLLTNGITPGGGERAVVFTEYADTAEWISDRLIAAGFPARTYSGRKSHAERDQVRAAFMAGDFQVIVSTDAGNEGIDLQVAHVLINYDIPWSLVRLEQRMGRIHRVGQRRDVELYNLVATDTREGDTLLKLLENFVAAANELDGQMFDSLSLIAELATVPYEEWLQTLYGDDELERAEVVEAVERISSTDLRRRAEAARAQEAELASTVDVAAGLAHIQRTTLEQMNPAVVEAYLRRLDESNVLRARHTAAGEGVMLLESDRPLPRALGDGKRALVLTGASGRGTDGESASAANALPLGPGSLAFTELVTMAAETLAADLYRGATVEDPTAPFPYELLAFSSSLHSSATRTPTPWSALIRVDGSGRARRIHWESLANLRPTRALPHPPDPITAEVAESEARRLLSAEVREQTAARERWYAAAKRDLTNLPVDLTLDVSSRAERIALRDRLAESAEHRIRQLEELCRLEADPPRLTARLQVVPPAGVVVTPERRQADAIAADHVMTLLKDDGWQVEDVRDEGRGFDLRAVRGERQSLVLARGVWHSAEDQGLLLCGNETLLAAQHRSDYLLYVVESCQDGRGSLYGCFADPVSVFTIFIRGQAITNIPGPALRSALDQLNAPPMSRVEQQESP